MFFVCSEYTYRIKISVVAWTLNKKDKQKQHGNTVIKIPVFPGLIQMVHACKMYAYILAYPGRVAVSALITHS